MKCKTCFTNQDLVCQDCYRYHQQKVSHFQIQSKIELKRQKAEHKLSQINIQNVKTKFAKHATLKKVEQIKSRIEQLKEKINIQKTKEEKLKSIKNSLQKRLTQNKPQIQKDQQTQNLILQNLYIKNQNLHAKTSKLKIERKKMLQKIMKIHMIDSKKYKIKKYFKLQSTSKLLFNQQKYLNGIPIIKASQQQAIVYHPLQNMEDLNIKKQKQQIINVIQLSSKLAFIVHKLFFPSVKLPYKLFCTKDYLYLGNLFVTLNTTLQLNSQQLKKAINMLQADIEFMAYIIGQNQKPFLVLNNGFLDFLELKKFVITVGKQNRKWQSSLKYLKLQQIERQYEDQQNQSQSLSLQTEGVYIFTKKSNQSDEQFEILQ